MYLWYGISTMKFTTFKFSPVSLNIFWLIRSLDTGVSYTVMGIDGMQRKVLDMKGWMQSYFYWECLRNYT